MNLAYSKYNPFRGPRWRLDRALELVDRVDRPGRTGRHDDSFVRGLRRFLLQYRASEDAAARTRLAAEGPGLYWAWDLYQRKAAGDAAGANKATLLEARLLAAQDDAEIAAEAGTLPETVRWYHALFFDVRPRLAAHDWVVTEVLVPAFEAVRVKGKDKFGNDRLNHPVASPYFDSTLKWFAYFGGPRLLDYVMTGFRRGARLDSAEGGDEWLTRHVHRRLRGRAAAAAQTFEVNSYNVMELFAVHNQIVQIERSHATAVQARDQVHTAIRAMLDGMKWAVGPDGKKLVAGTPVEAFDENEAVELRDDELLRLAADRRGDTIGRELAGLRGLALPPPPPRELDPSAEIAAATALPAPGENGDNGKDA